MPSQRPGWDARKTRRCLMQRVAGVILPGQEHLVRCVILDLSSGGARLAIGLPTAEIPRTFTLVLYRDRSALRECEVVWMGRRNIGVKFVSEWFAEKSAPPRQVKSPGSDFVDTVSVAERAATISAR